MPEPEPVGSASLTATDAGAIGDPTGSPSDALADFSSGDIAGGVLLAKKSDVIVPDGAERRPGQLYLSEFCRLLASDAVRRFCGSGVEICNDWGEDPMTVANWLAHYLALIISQLAGAENPDRFLRLALQLPLDVPLTPDDFLQAYLQRADPAWIARAWPPEQLPPEEEELRYLPDAESIGYLVGIGVPLAVAQQVGKLVHLTIQTHYLIDPQNAGHDIMCEARVYLNAGGALQSGKTLTSLVDSGTSTPIIKVLRQSLAGAVWWAMKRPDILDMTTREVYEIKPKAAQAVAQSEVKDYYLKSINGGIRTYNSLLAKIGVRDMAKYLEAYTEGTLWKALPQYFIPGEGYISVTQLPGVILYEVTQLPPGGPPLDAAAWAAFLAMLGALTQALRNMLEEDGEQVEEFLRQILQESQ